MATNWRGYLQQQIKGKVACTYCQQYASWCVVSNMVCSNLTAKMAIERVYMAYGHGTSTLEILKAMAKDKKLPGGARPKLAVQGKNKY